MTETRCLIVFAKNPVAGKVKTRLAAGIGATAALNVYQRLLRYTLRVAVHVNADKKIYYTDYIEPTDKWNEPFSKAMQQGDDLGERMKQAFVEVFREGYKKVLIIGTDCPEIDVRILEDAYTTLDQTALVIGPAHDGGYYLLGMTEPHPSLFDGIHWSTATVLDATLAKCQAQGLGVSHLPVLHDVDDAADLPYTDKLDDH